MKKRLIPLLKKAGLYYSLQGVYRDSLAAWKRFRLRAKYAPFKGAGFTCQFCHKSYSRFAPWYPQPENRRAIEHNHVIAGYGENILCPNCLSTARERLIRAVLDIEAGFTDGRILHVAPEKKLFGYLKKRASVTTADYQPGFYRRIDPDIVFADLTNLHFETGAFNLIIANHVLEHIPQDKRAMSEIFRVLRPGGKAILQVPFSDTISSTLEEPGIKDPGRQSALFGQADHVRIYAKEDYMWRLRSVGFTVNYRSYEDMRDFHSFAVQPGEGFFVIEKE